MATIPCYDLQAKTSRWRKDEKERKDGEKPSSIEYLIFNKRSAVTQVISKKDVLSDIQN